MANVYVKGASYSDVPAIALPTPDSGTATFVDTSDDTVTASTLLSGYTAHDASGNAITGTASAGGYTIDQLANREYELTGDIVTNAEALGAMTFAFCSNITSITAPYLKTLYYPDSSSYANSGLGPFYYCTGLRSVSLGGQNSYGTGRIYVASGGYQFAKCTSLTSININCNAGQYMFYGCTALTTAVLRANSDFNSNAFRNCTALTIADINPTALKTYEFRDCSRLTTIILRSPTVATLGNVNSFSGTKFASGGAGGTIYVPSSLISSYQSATNWSTLNGYGTVTWEAIEGSQYENYYADGTAVS